jgi:enamine deaminase RidA (YjgF/YER057c/UK114 family)
MNPLIGQSTLRVCFGGASGSPGALHLPIPVLAGHAVEEIMPGLREIDPCNGFRLFARDGWLWGASCEPVAGELSGQTRGMYQRLLGLLGNRRLVRVWNYVPRINQTDAEGLENYRSFCRGRSLAFEERMGAGYREHLPAASAVGGAPGQLAVVFAASCSRPEHVENPDQVPAYDYPPEHGPRPPSFARATQVAESGDRLIFVSGTAAIKGHVTMASGDLTGQIDCLLDNFDVLSRACGLTARLGAGEGWTRHFKIYLRHAADQAAAAARLRDALYGAGDRVTWLHADICRAALLIEIEATLVARG